MSSLKENNRNSRHSNLSSVLVFIGFILIGLSLVIFILTFYPVMTVELKYQLQRPDKNTAKKVIVPVDKEFGIVIPKIEANAKVVPNVSPFNEKEYQWQLTKGVVQAKGTAFPGQWGNVFIFAHSAGNFYDANRYNAIFFLLTKMEKGDDIYLFYKSHKFIYKVTDKKIVEASAVQYLAGDSRKKTVTLMTCWPAGTTLKRLLIVGELAEGGLYTTRK